MHSYHAAPWSPRYDEHDRITHQKRTKQREREEQRFVEKWTCDEILDDKGSGRGRRFWQERIAYHGGRWKQCRRKGEVREDSNDIGEVGHRNPN